LVMFGVLCFVVVVLYGVGDWVYDDWVCV